MKVPKVAVITRTRSRPRMLVRALNSVSSQTMKDFVWVVVNDGGEAAAVDAIIQQARDAGLEVSAIHHEVSKGMEAASNAGICTSKSHYVAIHDDDDTWEPDFLVETVQTLEARADWVGVTAHTMRVTERLRQDSIVTISREPHTPVLKAVHLADMLRSNLYPPISFLYRRALYKRLKGYEESMLVLGDWDFNLRALLEGDIGVVPKVLANYHVRQRQRGMDQAYANSISPHLMDHLIADAAYRNKWLRHDISEGKLGLGFLLTLSRLQARSTFPDALNRMVPRFLRRS